MIKLAKKKKIDYEAIALFKMAKDHYKKCDEYVKALYEHFKIEEDDQTDIDLWQEVIEQGTYSEMNKCRMRWTKDLQKKKIRDNKKR